VPGVDHVTRRVSRSIDQPGLLREVGVEVYLDASLRPPSFHKIGSNTARRDAAPQAVLTRYKRRCLLLDSGVFTDQQLNERPQQRFASLADVVHKLEEPQVEREFLL